MSETATQHDSLISVDTVAAMMEIDRATVWRWAKANRVPAPVVQRPKFTRWRRSDIERFIEELAIGQRIEAAS